MTRFHRRRRLSPSAREALYDAVLVKQIAMGLTRDLPLCNLCGMPILKGVRWHESHAPAPHAITGAPASGISHPRCNLDRNHQIDTPWVAKSKRQRRMAIGAKISRTPMQGGRDSPLKKKISGEVVRR